jgi:hypothetical protein
MTIESDKRSTSKKHSILPGLLFLIGGILARVVGGMWMDSGVGLQLAANIDVGSDIALLTMGLIGIVLLIRAFITR